jgi:hypothetical protein
LLTFRKYSHGIQLIKLFKDSGSQELKMEAARASEILVSYRNTAWSYNAEQLDSNLHLHQNFTSRTDGTKLLFPAQQLL